MQILFLTNNDINLVSIEKVLEYHKITYTKYFNSKLFYTV
jgi:hypothetical protein